MRILFISLLMLLIAGCTLPTETDHQVFTSQQIEQAIQRDVLHCSEICMLDTRYLGYTQDELRRVLDACGWIADIEYQAEYHDCEEYAIETMAYVRGSLRGIPFGFAKTSTHAENLFVDDRLNCWIVDLKRHGSELLDASHAFYFWVMI